MGGIIAFTIVFAFFCPICLRLITDRQYKRKSISYRKAGMSHRNFARENKRVIRTSTLPNSLRAYCHVPNILNNMEVNK